MGKGNAKDMTTKQVNMNRNPKGKGGFSDNPQNRSDGRWNKENSYSYWMHFFKGLAIEDFKKYKNEHPDMNMAALGAYARVAKSIDDRGEFQEVANRTEGMPRQTTDITSDGEKLEGLVVIKDASSLK